jgi:hypothetical protein
MGKVLNEIGEAAFSNNSTVKTTYEILRATWVITYDIKELPSLVRRWKWEDGRSGMRQILTALTNAKRGIISVVVFSKNKKYQTYGINEYEVLIRKNPNEFNSSIAKGMYDLYKQGKGFKKETWSDLSVYCESMNWETNIIGKDVELWTALKELYTLRKKQEEKVIQWILNTFTASIEDIELKELLTKNNLQKRSDGTLDITSLIKTLQITNANDVPKKFAKFGKELKEQWDQLLEKARTYQKNANIKNLKSLWIEKVPKEIENLQFAQFTLAQANTYIPLVEKKLKEEKDPNKKKDIQEILKILFSIRTWHEAKNNAVKVNQKSKTAEKYNKQNPNGGLDSIIKNDETESNRIKEKMAGDAGQARSEMEQSKTILKDEGIETTNIHELQKQYKNLQEKEKSGTITEKERERLASIRQFFQSQQRIAQVYINYKDTIPTEERNEIFQNTNRFISGKEDETYDFKSLERFGILSNTESSPADRSFAQLEPGKSFPIKTFVDDPAILQSNPEAMSLSISENKNGTYNIIPQEWQGLTVSGLTEWQAREYISTIELFSHNGLGQLIPHLPTLIKELKGQSVSVRMDGTMSNTEQRILLWEIHKWLFGSIPNTTNLHDIERSFRSHLDPTNLRGSLQNILIGQKLIKEAHQWIQDASLISWLRSNDIPNMDQQFT